MIRHFLGVWHHEGREGRPGHEARPPSLAVVRHVVADEPGRPVRGWFVGPLVNLECRGQREGLGVIHLAIAVVAVAIAGNASVALSEAPVLRNEAMEVVPRIELDRRIDVARPVVHVHLLGLLGEEHVVHGHAPWHAASIGPVLPPVRAGDIAVACLADIRGVSPRHATARQSAVVRASCLHSHPIRDGTRLARGVVEDVVTAENAGIKARNQILQLGRGAIQKRRQILVKLRLPIPAGEVSEHSVVRWGEVPWSIAPIRYAFLPLELAIGRREAAPLGACFRQHHLAPVGQLPVQIREAEVRGGEGDDAAHHQIDEVIGIAQGCSQVHHSEQRILVSICGGPVASVVLARRPHAQLPGELPSGHARGGAACAADRGDAVGPGIDLGGGAVVRVGAAEWVVGDIARALDHAQPGSR
mmetsp:Transcript_106130/g.269520  ORF Transcript_106130/g.269520 Transcript_106130/m.269520 type:complete len:416 (-) Transcript_106130:459-1706(-)